MKKKIHFVCSVNFFNDREKAFKDIAQFMVSNKVQKVLLIKGPYVSEDKKEMAYFIDAECFTEEYNIKTEALNGEINFHKL